MDKLLSHCTDKYKQQYRKRNSRTISKQECVIRLNAKSPFDGALKDLPLSMG